MMLWTTGPWSDVLFVKIYWSWGQATKIPKDPNQTEHTGKLLWVFAAHIWHSFLPCLSGEEKKKYTYYGFLMLSMHRKNFRWHSEKFFSYFSQIISFDIFCKLSPKESGKGWNSYLDLYSMAIQSTLVILHYENMPIYIYWKFHHQKLKVFRKKILIFFIFLLKT